MLLSLFFESSSFYLYNCIALIVGLLRCSIVILLAIILFDSPLYSTLMHYRYDLLGPNLSHPRIFKSDLWSPRACKGGASMIVGDKFHYLMASIQREAIF